MKFYLRIFRAAFRRFQEHEGPRTAASIAFFVLFSAAPSIALLVLSMGWVIRDPHEQAHVLGHMLEVLPVGSPQNRTFLLDAVRSISKASAGISVLGIVGMAWSSLGMFSAMRWGLNRAWGVRGGKGFVGVRLRDLAAMLGIWILLLISAVGTTAIHVATGEHELLAWSVPWGPRFAWAATQWTIPAVLSFAAFLYVYWYVPQDTHHFRDVFPAAIVATVLFEISKYLFGLYVSFLSRYSPLFGALGGILGFMLWIYVCATILLMGAEFAVVTRHRRAEATRA
jgi:membrane protein